MAVCEGSPYCRVRVTRSASGWTRTRATARSRRVAISSGARRTLVPVRLKIRSDSIMSVVPWTAGANVGEDLGTLLFREAMRGQELRVGVDRSEIVPEIVRYGARPCDRWSQVAPIQAAPCSFAGSLLTHSGEGCAQLADLLRAVAGDAVLAIAHAEGDDAPRELFERDELPGGRERSSAPCRRAARGGPRSTRRDQCDGWNVPQARRISARRA
jgi:hypothetical protein